MNAQSVRTYQGNHAEITFFKDLETDSLLVNIETQNLYMRSVQATQEDIELYKALYGDQEVMKLFHDGLPKSAEYIEGRIRNTWADR